LSRRNNEERFGAPHPDAPTPTPTIEAENNIFSFVVPTEFVELPSAGAYYAEGHPLHKAATVEIKHMTAKEEDILTSASLIKSGVVLDRLVQSVIQDKTIDPGTLLLGDKNAILVAARITGYGPHYDVNTRCPSCQNKTDQVFNLEDIESSRSTVNDNVEDNGDGTFTFDLPAAGVHLTVRLLTSADEQTLSQTIENKKRITKETSPVTDLLKSVIVSVNGVTKPSMLHEFVDLMPLSDVRFLRTTYEDLKPDVDLTFDFTCAQCDHEGEVTMPLTAKFFWPDL